MLRLEPFLAALFLAGLAVSARAQVTVTDDFSAPVNFITDGVAGTMWDGIYLGAGEIANPTGTGNTPGSVSVADANLTSLSNLTIQSVHTDWENTNDDGVFLYKVINGNFDMSVRVVPPIDAGNFNLQGLMVRAFGPGGAPLQPTNGATTENFLIWGRFNQFVIANMRKNNLNGVKADTGLGVNPNSNYWLRMERVGNTFNLYERALETDPWVNVGSQIRADFSGANLQVGIEQAIFNSGTTRTGRYEKFSLTASNMGPFAAAPAPASALTVTNNTNTVNLSWTQGAGSDGSVVVMWMGPAVLKQAPANGFTYTGNPVFGSGSRLPAAAYYVVYSGTGTNVTVTNLIAGSNYNVAVFAYAGAGSATAYADTPATASFGGSTPLPPPPAGNIRVDPASPALTNYTSLGEWNTDGNFENWTVNQVSDALVLGGVLSGTNSGSDSKVLLGSIVGGPDLDLGFNDQLEIRMQVPSNYNGDIQIFYGTTATTGYDVSRVFTIASALIPKDGAFHVYRIDTGLEVRWRSFLRDLRIDPIDASAGNGLAFAIDYVRVGDLAGEVYLPRYTTGNPAPGGPTNELGQPVFDMVSKHFRFNWDPVVATHASWNTNLPRGTLRNLEETWQVYVKVLGYTEPSESWNPANRNGNRYKVNISTWHDGYWAGNEAPGSIAHARMNITPDGLRVDPPGLVVPHELMHVFQNHQKPNGGQTMEGMWWEGHANYARERWIYYYRTLLGAGDQSNIDANYIHSGHMIIGHGRDYYLSWPFFLYLDENPDNLPDLGDGTVANIWKTNTDNVYLYTTLDQHTAVTPVKDMVGYFARRQLTFDYQNQTSIMNSLNSQNPTIWRRFQLAELVRRADDTNWWRVPMEMAPMQGAYATHELVPQGSGAGRVVTVNFRGLPDAARLADWRASFVVISDAGVERYTPLWSANTNSITLAADENRLYLAVAGTPRFDFTGHNDLTYPYRSHSSKQRLHYEVQVTGATPRESVNGGTAGMIQHANGGGWRATGAGVDASAFIGPNARVYNTAQVRGNARVEDYAVVSNAVQVLDNAVVSGHALVRNNAIIRDSAKVRDWAHVSGNAVVSDHGRVLEHAQVTGGTVTGYGIAKGSAIFQGGLVTDWGVVEGDFMANRNVTNGFAYGHQPFEGVPDSWIRVAPNRQYVDYEFAAATESMARDQIGVTDAYLVGSPGWLSSDSGRSGTRTFNGTSQYVVMDKSLSDTAEISIAAWVKWGGGVSNQPVWHFGSATNKCMYLTPSDNGSRVRFIIRNGGPDQTLVGPAALTPGTWTHVVVTLSNNTGRLYVNGVLQQQGAITITPEQLNAPNVNTASQHHYLARGADNTQPFFNGSLDAVMIYTRALTGAEITAMVPANLSPSFTGSVGNQVTPAGVTLLITNSTTDPNLPWQTLAFTLQTAPTGAAIGSNTGVFTWRPAANQASTTNPVTIRVADNGSPSLQALRNFSITVPPLALPSIGTAFLTNGQPAFEITGDAGPDYCIQISTNLVDWTTIATNFSPALPFVWVDTNSVPLPALFYRVILKP